MAQILHAIHFFGYLFSLFTKRVCVYLSISVYGHKGADKKARDIRAQTKRRKVERASDIKA